MGATDAFDAFETHRANKGESGSDMLEFDLSSRV